MFDLKCKRVDCNYNKNCNCTVKHLDINNDTSCDSYHKSDEKANLKIEDIEKIDQPAVRKNIEVDCYAKCLFNNNSICEANGITVQTCENKYCPNCCTFMPR